MQIESAVGFPACCAVRIRKCNVCKVDNCCASTQKYVPAEVAALDETALADIFAALESDRLQWRELAARSAVRRL